MPNRPPNVAIVGRPNVGKSALFNRLVGRKIAIVHDQPGITRDRISAICNRGARPFTVWDTGGMAVPQSRDELSLQVRRAAEEALRESDLLLFVVDAKEGLSPIDEELARALRKSRKPVVLVINKIDNEKHEPLEAEFDSLGFEPSFSISAEHDRGISDLLEEIERRLPSAPHDSRTMRYETLAVAIVGRPNVGKSSLINSIVRGERAIVSELPGTTRDAVDILYERDARKFVFIDTAGIRRRSKHSSSVEVFCAHHAEHLHRTRRFAAPADSCGIDENELSPVALVKNVNGIAGRSGQLAHDRALSAHNGIDERGFSDVWPADDRHCDWMFDV